MSPIISHPLLRLLGASALAVACMGSASAQTATIADAVTLVTLSPGDKEDLLNNLFNDLNKDDDNQQAHVWQVTGENGTPVTVTYNFSNSAMTEHSLKAHLCRDLKLVVTANGQRQDLSRRTCSQDSGRWDIQGKDAPPVVYPPFLSDVTVATLNAQEQAALLNAAVDALRDEPDGQGKLWSNQGLGNSLALKVTLTPSETGAKPGSYRICRDLTMLIDGKGGQQSLTRRACENRYHRWDIEADYVDK